MDSPSNSCFLGKPTLTTIYRWSSMIFPLKTFIYTLKNPPFNAIWTNNASQGITSWEVNLLIHLVNLLSLPRPPAEIALNCADAIWLYHVISVAAGWPRAQRSRAMSRRWHRPAIKNCDFMVTSKNWDLSGFNQQTWTFNQETWWFNGIWMRFHGDMLRDIYIYMYIYIYIFIIILNYIILYHIILNYITPCHIVLCYVMYNQQ